MSGVGTIKSKQATVHIWIRNNYLRGLLMLSKGERCEKKVRTELPKDCKENGIRERNQQHQGFAETIHQEPRVHSLRKPTFRPNPTVFGRCPGYQIRLAPISPVKNPILPYLYPITTYILKHDIFMTRARKRITMGGARDARWVEAAAERCHLDPASVTMCKSLAA